MLVKKKKKKTKMLKTGTTEHDIKDGLFVCDSSTYRGQMPTSGLSS